MSSRYLLMWQKVRMWNDRDNNIRNNRIFDHSELHKHNNAQKDKGEIMKLSIIIPYYNVKEYTDELLACLDRQMEPGVEVILVDDGSKVPYRPSYPWLTVTRQKNKGPGPARNKGLDRATGEYIAFIDSDDLVAEDYLKQILAKINDGFDVCDMSWKSLNLNGAQHNYKLRSENDRLSNPSVCTRVFNSAFIGETRFSVDKDSTEDEDFSRRLGYLDPERMKGKKYTAITDYMYFYRTEVSGSNVKKYKDGLRKTKRVVYYYDRFTADMKSEFEQIKEDDMFNEVWLLTNYCEVPEVKRYAQVSKPFRLWTHFLKGEPYTNVEVIPPPYQTQVVLFINQAHIIGGIETFILNFAKIMRKYYDITFVVNNCPDSLAVKVARYVRVIRNDPTRQIVCDTLIMLRILDNKPTNIYYKRSIQMCHACKTNENWHIPQDTDYIVNVSEASRASFGDEAKSGLVIHNLIEPEPKKTLLLMSATRIPAPDKGNNEKRMRILCEMLKKAEIPFVWLNFSEGKLNNAPEGFYNLGLSDNIQDFMQKADYIVQLSDSEAYSYTILEALTVNKPVIVTPFPSASEMGIQDGVNGYIVPFDMDFDVKRLLDIPQFEYEYDLTKNVKKWRFILGNTHPKKNYKPDAKVKVRIICEYYDTVLQTKIDPETILEVDGIRADTLVMAKVGVRI